MLWADEIYLLDWWNKIFMRQTECADFEQNLEFAISSIQVNITLEWMPDDLIDDGKSTLLEFMAWQHQTTKIPGYQTGYKDTAGYQGIQKGTRIQQGTRIAAAAMTTRGPFY